MNGADFGAKRTSVADILLERGSARTRQCDWSDPEELGAVVSLETKPGYFVTNKVSFLSRQYRSKKFDPATNTPVMEDSRRRKRHCWECRRRCLVCDFTEPACRRCSAAGVECPGYGDAKPMRLEWLAPGRVISRGRRRKGKRQSDGEKGYQVNNIASRSQVLARTSYVPWFEMKTDVCALPQAAKYCEPSTRDVSLASPD